MGVVDVDAPRKFWAAIFIKNAGGALPARLRIQDHAYGLLLLRFVAIRNPNSAMPLPAIICLDIRPDACSDPKRNTLQ